MIFIIDNHLLQRTEIRSSARLYHLENKCTQFRERRDLNGKRRDFNEEKLKLLKQKEGKKKIHGTPFVPIV